MKIPIAPFFYWDHIGRDLDTPVNYGTEDRVIIDAFDPAVEELISDCAYYCDEFGPDACGDGGKLKRSALAIIKALLKARPELANEYSMRDLIRQKPHLISAK